jgi:hypothetical protein
LYQLPDFSRISTGKNLSTFQIRSYSKPGPDLIFAVLTITAERSAYILVFVNKRRKKIENKIKQILI